jgi:hypothetical protein
VITFTLQRLAAGLFGLCLLIPSPAAAAWPADPLVNVPVCTATGDQMNVASASDGAGGVIVTWHDPRNGTTDIYAQRISADGVAQWQADGVALCTAIDGQHNPVIVPDGAGGAIVAWLDLRGLAGYDIFAQRISASGTVLWRPNGVALCTATGSQISATIASDSAGGAIVTWEDYRDGNGNIYAQRISAGGTPMWAAEGVALCTAIGTQEFPTITSDGAGGAIVTWWDGRSGDFDIYAQAISSVGTPLWTADGAALCTVPGIQEYPTIAPDGAGGAIVTWQDFRAGTVPHIYAQRIPASGTPAWTADGVAVCSAALGQYLPSLVLDGAGGAIIVWTDKRYTSFDIFTQRISSSGAPLWAPDGVPLCLAGFGQVTPAIVSDDAGGAIVAWSDSRSLNVPHIYAQRILGDGTTQWTADGEAVCTASGSQYAPSICPDGVHGATISWYDNRGGLNYDVYAQRVLWYGLLGGDVAGIPGDAGLAFALSPVRPNPSRGGALTVDYSLPNASTASIELLDVAGRRIASHEVGALGAGHHVLSVGDGRHLAPGLYLVRLRQGASVRVSRAVVL